MITTVQCSICSQLNNKPRVVVTDFMLHHTCSILILLWLHSLSGVIRSLLCNPHTFIPAGAHELPEGLQGESNSALWRAKAFDSEQLAHLPFMELFSSGGFPLWSLREGVRHARFRLMSDVDDGIGDSRPW